MYMCVTQTVDHSEEYARALHWEQSQVKNQEDSDMEFARRLQVHVHVCVHITLIHVHCT